MKSQLAEFANQDKVKDLIKHLEKDLDKLPEKIEDIVFNSLIEHCGNDSIRYLEDNKDDVQQMFDDLYFKYAKDLMYHLYRTKELLEE